MDYDKNKTYYEILKVESDASFEAIEAAKNKLKFGDPKERAPFELWGKIDEAYKVLSNPSKRKEYDEKIGLKNNNAPVSWNSDQFDDVYSDSTHRNTSILNGDDVTLGEVLLPKLKKVGLNLVLALPTATLGTVTVIKEIKKEVKYSVVEESTEKEIKEPQTEESLAEETYRKNIEEQINKKMSEYHYNYGLQIDKIRLENRIELLKARIKQKENQNVKMPGLLKYKLELTSLRNQLEAFYRCLDKVNKDIYEVNKSKEKQTLTKVNDKLINVNKKIKELTESSENKIFKLKSLEARRSSLKKLRNYIIDKQIGSHQLKAIFKEGFISAYARSENFVKNLLVPIDKIDEKEKMR